MDLKEWLTKKKIMQQDFARDIGIAPFYLYQILTKRRYAGRDLAQTIETATKGKVKAVSLLRPVKKRVPCPTCGKLCDEKILIDKKSEKDRT